MLDTLRRLHSNTLSSDDKILIVDRLIEFWGEEEYANAIDNGAPHIEALNSSLTDDLWDFWNEL